MGMATVKNEQAEHAEHERQAVAESRPPGHAPVPAPEAQAADAHGSEPARPERKAPAPSSASAPSKEAAREPRDKEKRTKNNVRKIRMERMMSKAELARRAGVSTLTIDRVENGLPCRMDTKRKILEALGLNPPDRVLVFGEDD